MSIIDQKAVWYEIADAVPADRHEAYRHVLAHIARVFNEAPFGNAMEILYGDAHPSVCPLERLLNIVNRQYGSVDVINDGELITQIIFVCKRRYLETLQTDYHRWN